MSSNKIATIANSVEWINYTGNNLQKSSQPQNATLSKNQLSTTVN